MELETAIANLANPDAFIRAQAIDVCKSFQTPEFFDWNTIFPLLQPNQASYVSIFAYTSIVVILKKYWSEMPPETQTNISNSFPFFTNINSYDQAILNTIFHCSAVYMAYIAPIEQINNFFSSTDDSSLQVFATILSDFIVCVYTNSLNPQRENQMTSYLLGNSTNYIVHMILAPISELDANSDLFEYFLEILANIHKNAPSLLEVLLTTPNVEELYTNLCPFLWNVSNNTAIINLFDSILDTKSPPQKIINQLAMTAHDTFYSNYSILYDFENDIEELTFISCVDSFVGRIHVFFSILEHLDLCDLGDFLLIINQIIRSTSPTVIKEVANQLINFLNRFSESDEFKVSYYQHRMAIFESCTTLISFQPENLPGAKYDYNTTSSSLRTSLFELIKTIARLFDYENVSKNLIQFTLDNTKETPYFMSLIRILISIVTESYVMTEESRASTVSLIKSLHTYSEKLQYKICLMLEKWIPHLQLDSNQANELFMMIVETLTNPEIANTPFSAYFMSFLSVYESIIQIPVEQLQTIPPENPAYFTVSRLLGNLTPLMSSIGELQWFVDNFDPSQMESVLRMNRQVRRSLNYFMNLDIAIDESTANEIIELLFKSHNIIIEYSDMHEDKSNESRMSQIINSLAGSLFRIAQVVPQTTISHLSDLQVPTKFTHAAVIWMKRIASDLLSLLFNIDPETIEHCASMICITMLEICIKIEDEAAFEPSYVANSKKIAVLICEMCFMLNEELCYEILTALLRINDLKIFSTVCKVLVVKSESLLAKLWEHLLKNRDDANVTAVVSMLFELYEKNEGSIEFMQLLPGSNEEALVTLNNRLAASQSDKTKRRHFKNFIDQIFS